jgi:hypothetical protein
MSFIYRMINRRANHTQKMNQISICGSTQSELSYQSIMIILLLCLSGCLTSCQFFLRVTTSHSTAEDSSYETTPRQPEGSQDLVIQQAFYQGVFSKSQRSNLEGQSVQTTLNTTSTGHLRVDAKLLLSAQDNPWRRGEERSLTLNVPQSTWTDFKVNGDCRISQDALSSVKRTFKCRPNTPNQATLNVSYTIAWSEMTGHHVITEGERQYHIVYLAAPLGGEMLLGFSKPQDFPRKLSFKAPEDLQLFGHEVSGRSSFQAMVQQREPDGVARDSSSHRKEKESKQSSGRDEAKMSKDDLLKWREIKWQSIKKHSSFSMFFSFGSWEMSQAFHIQLPQAPKDQQLMKSGQSDHHSPLPAQLIAPLGSRFHRVGQFNLRRL